jgi:hypothetical protein
MKDCATSSGGNPDGNVVSAIQLSPSPIYAEECWGKSCVAQFAPVAFQRADWNFRAAQPFSDGYNATRAFCTTHTRISASAQRTVRRLEVASLMKACQKCACRLHVRVGTEFSYSPRLARVKDPLRVGKFEKASSSKLLKEFRLPYLDNPSSHARPHDGHTLVDSF